jgi:hypothetical protein
MALSFSATAGFIGVDTTYSDKTLQLPAISARNGRVITFKDKTGNAANNQITLQVNIGAGDLFEDGGTTLVINQNYGFVTIVARTDTWYVIQQSAAPVITLALGSTVNTSTLFVPLLDVPTTSTNQWFSFLASTQGTYFGGAPGLFNPLPSISTSQIFIADVTTSLLHQTSTNTITIEQEPSTSEPIIFDTYSGTDETYTVPAGVTRLYIEIYGGGGGNNQYGTHVGGKGGFISAYLDVEEGDTFNIIIGKGGSVGGTGDTYTYGGDAGNGDVGQGGGYTVVEGTYSITAYLIAAGGGGAGPTTNGAPGGGEVGGSADTSGGTIHGGQGATQIADGYGGESSVGQSGEGASIGGGGGGGGWYGGGGGGENSGGENPGGGGGGSSGYEGLFTAVRNILGGGSAAQASGRVIIYLQHAPVRSGNYIEVRDGVSKFLLSRDMTMGINVLSNAPGYTLTVGGSTLMSSITTASLQLTDTVLNTDSYITTAGGYLYVNGNLVEGGGGGGISSVVASDPIDYVNSGGHVTLTFLSSYGQNLGTNYGYLSTYSNVVYMSTKRSITSSISGNLADALTLILFDL